MHRDFKGVWIPKAVYLNPNLSWTEKILLTEIHSLEHNEGCFASNEYLAEFLQVGAGRVANLISQLKASGFLQSEGFGHRRILRVEPSLFSEKLSRKSETLSRKSETPIYRIINTEINTEEEHILSVELSENGKSRPKKKGSRLPDDFEVTAEMVEWAAEWSPSVDLNLETEKFKNYWAGVAGAKGVKLNWKATWRNWMLNAEGYKRERSKNGKNQGATSTNTDKLAGYQAIFAKYRPEGEG